MATTTQVGTGSGGFGTTTVTLTINESGAFVSGTITKTPNPVQNANSPQQPQVINLSSGNNTITVPTLAGGVIIEPPTTNTNALILKGVNGDTGVTINAFSVTMLTFASTPPASFVLNAAGSVSGVQFYWF